MSSAISHEVTEKTCTLCSATKTTADFYRDRATRDGLHPWCKECQKQRARKHYYDHHDRHLATKAKLRSNPEWRKALLPKHKEYKERNPEKTRARVTLNNAIKRGKIQRQPCEQCGDPRGQGHHHDYSKPFDVHWLCIKCHGKEHRTSPEGIAALAEGK